MSGLMRVFEKIYKSGDNRRVFSNIGYLTALQIASLGFPLLTIPYLAHVIGAEGLGKIAVAMAVTVWLQTISTWGFNYTATRDVARVKDDINKVSEIFSNVLWARLGLVGISLVFLLLGIYFVPFLGQLKAVLLVSFMLVPSSVLFPDWMFQALEKMKFITIFSVASKSIFTLSVFVFINEESDYILQPLLIVLGQSVSAIFSLYVICVKWKVKIKFTSVFAIYKCLKNSSNVFVNSIAPNLYNSFSIILLGYLGGNASSGILDVGKKVPDIAQQFIQILSRAFFPLLSRRSSYHGLYSKINLLVAICSSAVLILLAPYIIGMLFPKEFQASVPVMQIMASSIIFLSLANTYGINYLVLHGYEKHLRNLTLISSIIGFLLAFPLIFYFDYIGAALTIALSRMFLGILTTRKAKVLRNSS